MAAPRSWGCRAGVIVMAIAALTVLFSKAERPKAVGVWFSGELPLASPRTDLGGWLLTHYWWAGCS